MSAGCCADKSCTPETCMALGDGRTCEDCALVGRCVSFGVTKPEHVVCDFFPRRFRLQQAAES